tara:strand:+ start:1012 stop:1269 length:258 start_codon:yes stop_codon:yes gene_type:complete
MVRENGVWVIQTCYLADLDPLDESLRHFLSTLPDPNAKDPSAWSPKGVLGRNVRGMSVIYEYSLQSDEHLLKLSIDCFHGTITIP